MNQSTKQSKPLPFTRSTIGATDQATIESKQVLVLMPDNSTRRVASVGAKSANKIEVELKPDLILDRTGKRGPDGKLANLRYKLLASTGVRIYELPQRRQPKPLAPPPPEEPNFERLDSAEGEGVGWGQGEIEDDDESGENHFVAATVVRLPGKYE